MDLITKIIYFCFGGSILLNLTLKIISLYYQESSLPKKIKRIMINYFIAYGFVYLGYLLENSYVH